MVVKKVSVFISSTSDLSDERQVLKNMIKGFGPVYDPFLFEDVPARGESPEEYCRRMVKSSDIFVGILGGKYGSLYPPDHEGSIVEFEISEALSRDGLNLTAVLCKECPPEEIQENQRAFRERISTFNRTEGDKYKGGIWQRNYNSLEVLTAEVQASITNWLGEVYLTVTEGEEPLIKKLQKRIKIISVVITGLALVVFLIYLIMFLTGTAFFLTTTSTFVFLAILAVALLFVIAFAIFLL